MRGWFFELTVRMSPEAAIDPQKWLSNRSYQTSTLPLVLLIQVTQASVGEHRASRYPRPGIVKQRLVDRRDGHEPVGEERPASMHKASRVDPVQLVGVQVGHPRLRVDGKRRMSEGDVEAERGCARTGVVVGEFKQLRVQPGCTRPHRARSIDVFVAPSVNACVVATAAPAATKAETTAAISAVLNEPFMGTPRSWSARVRTVGRVFGVGCSTVGLLRPDRYLPHEGSRMPKVVITHAVEDIDLWLQGKAERAAAIESGTGSNVTDYVAQDGSNNIAITADVSDPATLQGMLASPPPEVLAAMEEHGVIQPISAYVEA